MSDFVVRWEKIADEGRTYESMKKTVDDCNDRLKKVKSNLAGMSGFGNVTNTINTVINNVDEQIKDIKTIGQTIEAIAFLYKVTEQKISGVVHGSTTVRNPNGDGRDVDWGEGAWEILSKFGITGQYASMVNDLVSGEYFNAAASGVGLFGELLDNAYSPNPKDLRSLLFGLGVDDAVNAGLTSIAIGTSSREAAKAAWKEIASGYKFGDSVGKNLAVGAQWAVAIVDNGMDNYDEFGTMANARFWGETAVETAVDVGMGIAATAAVTAGAVALGVAAPAVAVAAVAGGVVWGVNTAVEYFTGKDVGEWAADAVCDGAEWLMDKAEKAGNVLASAGDAFCEWIGI